MVVFTQRSVRLHCSEPQTVSGKSIDQCIEDVQVVACCCTAGWQAEHSFLGAFLRRSEEFLQRAGKRLRSCRLNWLTTNEQEIAERRQVVPFEVLKVIDVDFDTVLLVEGVKRRAAENLVDLDVINAAGNEWLDVLVEQIRSLVNWYELGLEHVAREHDGAQRDEHAKRPVQRESSHADECELRSSRGGRRAWQRAAGTPVPLLICVTFEKSSWLVAMRSPVNLTLLEWLTAGKSSSITKASSNMAWVTTSKLNAMTKWHGAGHAAYDEAATALGAEVTPPQVDQNDRTKLTESMAAGRRHISDSISQIVTNGKKA